MKKTAILSRLLPYLLRYKMLLITCILLSIGGNLLALAGPYVSGLAVDAMELGTGKVDFSSVGFYSVLMVLLYIASAVLSYALTRLMIVISRRVVNTMRRDVFNKLTELPVGYFDTNQTGDILSRISYDIDTINTSLSNDIVQVFASVVTVVGALAMMLAISPVLVLVFVVTVPLSFLLTKKITGFTRPLFRKRSAKLGELNGFVEEMISGQKTLRAYSQEEHTIEKLDRQNDETVEAYYKADYYGSLVGPSVNFVNNLSLSLVSFFGAILYLGGAISIGNISSFVLYSRKFSGPINEVANIVGELQSAFSAAERVFRLLDEPPEPADTANAVDLRAVGGEVELAHVNFGYTPDRQIIKDLSLHVPKGALIAIVGPTGAGKTTIINLLMRFYDVDSGEIRLDGRPVRDLTRRSLRLNYSMVLQDTWLFSGTVFENIAYGSETATRADVERVCRACGIHEYIMTLPEGYDTVLDDDGSNISKGQKQLMTIARAMLLDASLLILDEATSNVDTRTEQRIQKAMRALMADKTCFVIAHRLSTIRNADMILVVRDGEIVERGTHDSLMAQDSFYKQLYNAQFA
ncbi:MAG TPA: ABC transporter ATP-binding protein/permease [Candidatus Ruminococcus gallistercoris]|nr:ABC transporter ATP-binding protein/permease [Candidatus Ruminococcus gallistercoris]